MNDLFQSFQSGLESPASRIFEVTPSDTADLPFASRAVNVAQAGYVHISTVSGDIGRIYIAAGIALPIRVSRIWSTGTTAVGITVLC